MPEGPECFALARRLDGWLAGARISSVGVGGGRYGQHGLPVGFEEGGAIGGGHRTVASIRSKGKLIYWTLDDGSAILNTLGMSGMWHKQKSKHCDLWMCFDQPVGRDRRTHPLRMWFKDQLHFGTLKHVDALGLAKKLRELGADVLLEPGSEGAITPAGWEALCVKRSEWTFPKLLMNQKSVSGVGNYLKSEILFAARTSPLKTIGDCTDEQIDAVYEAVTTIPRRALETKLRLQLAIRGRFHMRVYRKKETEGFVVKRVKTSDNRTTHWVPELQV